MCDSTSSCQPGGAADSGQISVLLIGMFAVALMLILGVVAATSVQLSRIDLLDAADAAALDAADSVAEAAAYRGGVQEGVPLTAEKVVAVASENLAARERPSRLTSWSLLTGTGTADGRTVIVRLQGEAGVPVIGRALAVFGESITITVESSARSDLD